MKRTKTNSFRRSFHVFHRKSTTHTNSPNWTGDSSFDFHVPGIGNTNNISFGTGAIIGTEDQPGADQSSSPNSALSLFRAKKLDNVLYSKKNDFASTGSFDQSWSSPSPLIPAKQPEPESPASFNPFPENANTSTRRQGQLGTPSRSPQLTNTNTVLLHGFGSPVKSIYSYSSDEEEEKESHSKSTPTPRSTGSKKTNTNPFFDAESPSKCPLIDEVYSQTQQSQIELFEQGKDHFFKSPDRPPPRGKTASVKLQLGRTICLTSNPSRSISSCEPESPSKQYNILDDYSQSQNLEEETERDRIELVVDPCPSPQGQDHVSECESLGTDIIPESEENELDVFSPNLYVSPEEPDSQAPISFIPIEPVENADADDDYLSDGSLSPVISYTPSPAAPIPIQLISTHSHSQQFQYESRNSPRSPIILIAESQSPSQLTNSNNNILISSCSSRAEEAEERNNVEVPDVTISIPQTLLKQLNFHKPWLDLEVLGIYKIFKPDDGHRNPVPTKILVKDADNLFTLLIFQDDTEDLDEVRPGKFMKLNNILVLGKDTSSMNESLFTVLNLLGSNQKYCYRLLYSQPFSKFEFVDKIVGIDDGAGAESGVGEEEMELGQDLLKLLRLQ